MSDKVSLLLWEKKKHLNYNNKIRDLTKQITEQSEILREGKNKNAATLQLLGQGSIIAFMTLIKCEKI